MKNIQVIDGAINCVYDIFCITNAHHALIFPNGTNIAFIEEVRARLTKEQQKKAFENCWSRPVRKADVNGIHGILFYELEIKKQFYPTRTDEEAVNPGGSLLRSAKVGQILRRRLHSSSKSGRRR
jgi:hypothetical protein